MFIIEELVEPFPCDKVGFCLLLFLRKPPAFYGKIPPPDLLPGWKRQCLSPAESILGRRKGKKPYHDLNNAVLCVVCHGALHLAVAHHTPAVTLALLILAYCTPLNLVFSRADSQLICKKNGRRRKNKPRALLNNRAMGRQFLGEGDPATMPSAHSQPRDWDQREVEKHHLLMVSWGSIWITRFDAMWHQCAIKAMVAEPTTETSAQLLSGFQGSFVGHLTQKAS